MWILCFICTHMHARTHTLLVALFPGLPRWAGTRKAKPIWILLKQETVSSSGISWNICKSAPCSRQITMPTASPLCFICSCMHSCCSILELQTASIVILTIWFHYWKFGRLYQKVSLCVYVCKVSNLIWLVFLASIFQPNSYNVGFFAVTTFDRIEILTLLSVSYTHLTLPTTPYV